MYPILIDCDTGIDDSLALLYACASPEAEILAVTCCSGNVAAEQVAQNTLAVLELAGRTDIEVAIGRPLPLIRALDTIPACHGPRGIGYAVLPPPSRPLSARHGADVIVETARARPGEVTLVTLGPLTNVAVALLREPALPRLVRRLVLMAGCFRVAGNASPREEWNVHCDPEAAKIVFQAFSDEGVVTRPLAICLDVSEQVRFVPDHLVALARRAGSRPDDSLALAAGEQPMRATGSVASNRMLRYLTDALRFYMEFHARHDGFYGAFMHDPFVLAAVLDPGLVRAEAATVDVEVAGTLTTGETVADWRHDWGRPPNCNVAVEANAAEFLARFIERVGGFAERMAGSS